MKDILGLLVLSWPLVLLVGIVIAILVTVPLAVRYARKRGHNKWAWGIGIFLLIFLPIFWDWIPTVVMHKYYCSTEAGFWVYKTAEQWKAENPGAVKPSDSSIALNIQTNKGTATQTYKLNKKLVWQRSISNVFLSIRRYEDRIYDVNSRLSIARRVYFESGKCSGAPKDISDMKFWLNQCECKASQTPFVNSQGISWAKIYKQFKEIGEE